MRQSHHLPTLSVKKIFLRHFFKNPLPQFCRAWSGEQIKYPQHGIISWIESLKKYLVKNSKNRLWVRFWNNRLHLLTSRSTFISLKWLVRVKIVIICPQKVFPNVAKALFHLIWWFFASRTRENACDTAFESWESILFNPNIY